MAESGRSERDVSASGRSARLGDCWAEDVWGATEPAVVVSDVEDIGRPQKFSRRSMPS